MNKIEQKKLRKEIKDNYKTRLDTLKAKVKKNPDAKNFLELAHHYKIYGKINDAIFCYDKALEIEPDIDALLEVANLHMYKGQSDKAHKALNWAKDIDKKNILVLEALAVHHIFQKKYNEGLELITKALQYFKCPKLLVAQAYAYEALESLEKTEESCDAAMEIYEQYSYCTSNKKCQWHKVCKDNGIQALLDQLLILADAYNQLQMQQRVKTLLSTAKEVVDKIPDFEYRKEYLDEIAQLQK